MYARMIPTSRLVLFALLFSVFCDPIASAQTASPAKVQSRYKVAFTPTFGGTDSHIGILGAHVLNNAGTLIGSADTTQPDPYAPDACFNANR